MGEKEGMLLGALPPTGPEEGTTGGETAGWAVFCANGGCGGAEGWAAAPQAVQNKSSGSKGFLHKEQYFVLGSILQSLSPFNCIVHNLIIHDFFRNVTQF